MSRRIAKRGREDDVAGQDGYDPATGTVNRRTIRNGCLLFVLAAASAFAGAARGADEEWSQCGPGFRMPARPVSETKSGDDPEAIDLSADDGELVEGGVSVLTGNVQVDRGARQLQTDRLTYTADDGTFDARGNVRFWDEGLYVTGGQARAENAMAEITVESDPSYMIEDRHGHGEAARITLSGGQRIIANDATYTTCNPGDADWRITASHVELDHAEETGAVRNMWLEFMGQRVFYMPWMSFPLGDRRKTGFLAPTYGIGGSRGVELTTPYYFNLASNRDATLTARTMSERGVQAIGELRFLSRTYGSGRVEAQLLPSDAKFGDDRAAFGFTHRHRWSSRWSTDTRIEWASDAEYFEDLGTDLAQSSRTHLPRRFDTRYRGDGWNALFRFQDFLTLDRTVSPMDRPYATLPQLLVRTTFPERNRALNFGATAELAYFEQRERTTGVRMDLRPSVAWPFRTSGAFVVPKATLHFTQYALDRAEDDAYMEDAPSRWIPSFSLDGGVFLERPVTFRGRRLTHTIEPRLYYLHVPFRRQDDLPVFDTGRFSFDFAQLFREDRFSGGDRLGDADQVALALTSRLLDDRGGELARAGVGQIRYFRDRRVTLDATEGPETARSSDVVAEVEARLARRWRIRAGFQYDAGAGRTARNTFGVRYRPDERRVVNATYRRVRDAGPEEAVEQADLSFAWPIGRDWRAVGRWNFALNEEENRTLEAFGGLEYESCCWGIRLVARRFLSGGRDGYSNGIFLQLELKGLTGVGHDADVFLERSIPGYEDEFR